MKIGTLRSRKDIAFETLIGRIYLAGGDPAAWTGMLEGFCSAFRGIGSLLDSYDFASATGRVHAAAGCASEYLRSYLDYTPARDAWTKDEGEFRASGAVWTGRQLRPDREFVRSEFYADWLRPQGWFHSIRGVVHREGDEVWYLTVAAPRTARPYGERGLALFRRLAPHVDRALRFQHVTSELRLRNKAATEVLDRLSVGVVLVSEAGRVIEMNAAAGEIVARRDGLRLRADRLEAMHNGNNAEFQALIAGTAARQDGADPVAGRAIALTKPSGHRSLSVLVTPVSTLGSAFGSERPAAIVFVGDPECAVEADTERLRRLFGLTRTEARLAGHLAGGRRLDEAAREMTITSLTARTHLKRIFSKTSTKRQAELVGLLLCGPGQMR